MASMVLTPWRRLAETPLIRDRDLSLTRLVAIELEIRIGTGSADVKAG
jgi:hypothetical protein